MLISLSWLKDFVQIKKGVTTPELANLLTLKTAEIDSVIDESEILNNIIIGHVETILPHPNADKLRIAKTFDGQNVIQIVCGGENLKEGMYVALAKIGAKVKWHGEGDYVTLERVKIRGEESEGMICASNEIGLTSKNEGPKDILDLSSIKPKAGTPLSEILKRDDVLFEFDNKSLTHRPDLWGHYGIAREIAALTDSKFKPLNPKVSLPTQGISIKVEVSAKELCPRYCGLIIENIKVQDSPDWLIARLKKTGHGAHNNIVDITNYVMTELGQPMHAFDKKLIEEKVIVRQAEKGEKITTLDNKTYELSPEMLIIADNKKPVALAGIMGGEFSGINENTTSIILESANFNAGSIRKTAVKLGLRTDSSARFEKALDPQLAMLAIKRATELILKICPSAKISGPITDVKNFDEELRKIILNTEKTASKIGVDIKEKEIKKILTSLEFEVKKHDKNSLEVTVPSFRGTKDVTIEDDLIEEVARIYGYDNIPAILPALPAKLPMENTERFKKHRARELFSYALGFDEAYNYSFYGINDIKKCLIKEEGHLKLLNFLAEDQAYLRTSLIPNLLKNICLNIKYFDEFKIYEIGRTYKEIGEFYPLEEKFIAGAIVKKGKTDEGFYTAKGAVESFFEKFSIKNIKMTSDISAPYAHPVKCATFLDESGQTLAKIFMLHSIVSNNFDLDKYSIAFFEINFTESLKKCIQEKKYQQLPRFPKIEIDVSVVLNKETTIEKIKDAIISSDNSIIKNVELFDIYEGDKMEAGKKSVAFRITLQAEDRTLTDDEMSKVQQKIFKNLETLGGIIRGK